MTITCRVGHIRKGGAKRHPQVMWSLHRDVKASARSLIRWSLYSGDRNRGRAGFFPDPVSLPNITPVYPFSHTPHKAKGLTNGLLLNFRLSGASQHGSPTAPARRGNFAKGFGMRIRDAGDVFWLQRKICTGLSLVTTCPYVVRYQSQYNTQAFGCDFRRYNFLGVLT